MANRKPLTDSEGEVRELTSRDAAEAAPFSALPEAERKMLRALQKREPKEALRSWLSKHKTGAPR